MSETPFDESSNSYNGKLLIAHPALRDPNFRESVVLISSHDPEEGAMGIIINRPTGEKLGQTHPDLKDSPLAQIPVFDGGPVNRDRVLICAWRLTEDSVEMFFGLPQESVKRMIAERGSHEFRAYCGYSGWSRNQLEKEHADNAWLIAECLHSSIGESAEPRFWRKLLAKTRPELLILADSPADPWRN